MARRARPDECCEARIDDACTGRAEHRHHRKMRSQGGSDDPSNLLAVCAACHRWIHDHPTVAYGRGWLVRSWDDVDRRCDVCQQRVDVSLRGWCAACEEEQARVDARRAAGDWIGGPW